MREGGREEETASEGARCRKITMETLNEKQRKTDGEKSV